MEPRLIIEIGIVVLGFLFGWLRKRRDRLPGNLGEWVQRVGQDDLVQFAAEAEAYSHYTSEERRQFVAEKIADKLSHYTGIPVTASVINFLVEYAYQLFKARK
jgi:hypothetical protein